MNIRKVLFIVFFSLLLSALLTSCGKVSSTVVVEDVLVDDFFGTKESMTATLNLQDSNLQSTKDLIEEYVTDVMWCGKNLPTTVCFYDDEPVMVSATMEWQNTDKCIEKINDDLILFEKQFKAKSISIIGEDGNSGKTIDYNKEAVSDELKRIVDSFGIITFKFSVPGKEDSKILVEYTCKRFQNNPDSIVLEYSIRNYRPTLK